MREPMRVIEGSTKPFEPFWSIQDASSTQSGETEVEFFGPISEYSWFGDEVTPALFKQQLYETGQGKPVTVKVNSPGGEVIAASVIRSILQEYPGKVTADIVGIAASAATIVVTGADLVRMRESALFMIHDPSAMAYGTVDELLQVADILKTVKSGIIDGYETKTGMDRKQLAKLMSDSTWMTARQAQEMGFVDEVVSGSVVKAPKAMRAGFLNCLKGLEIPEAVSDQLSALSAEEEPAPIVIPAGFKDDTFEVITDVTPASEGESADNNPEASALRERVQSILGRMQS